jgi:threonine/homoserine/homoserine lactone efflux protein
MFAHHLRPSGRPRSGQQRYRAAIIPLVGGEFAAFLGISILVIVTPGQDTALTIRNALVGGRGAGASTAAGVVASQLVWTLAASAGVTALLRASEPAFLAVKLAGAAYLTYLGLRALRSALFGWRGAHASDPARTARRITRPTAFRQGLVSNLGNPKMAVFFSSLLPQFAPHHGATFVAMLLLGLVFASMTLAWLTGYCFVVAGLGDVFRRSSVRRALDGITGVVLVGLGVRLATERA